MSTQKNSSNKKESRKESNIDTLDIVTGVNTAFILGMGYKIYSLSNEVGEINKYLCGIIRNSNILSIKTKQNLNDINVNSKICTSDLEYLKIEISNMKDKISRMESEIEILRGERIVPSESLTDVKGEESESDFSCDDERELDKSIKIFSSLQANKKEKK